MLSPGALRARIFQLGIAGRLSIAFVAVAVLATAANLIAEHGTQIIHSSVVVAPIERSRGRSRAAPAQTAADAFEEVDAQPLLEAIDRYERAVERRANDNTAEAGVLLENAATRLKSQVETFLEKVNNPVIDGHSRALRVGLASVAKNGDHALRVADERRAMVTTYWSHFDSAESQVRKTLDQNNWKIFGRVVSRQSLSSLSRELDDIRRQSMSLTASGEDARTFDSLAQSHARLTAMLDQNAPALSRSQGQQWVADLRADLAAVVESRERLAQLAQENPRALAAFERGSQELGGLARQIAGDVGRRAQAAATAVADGAPGDRATSDGHAEGMAGVVPGSGGEALLHSSEDPATGRSRSSDASVTIAAISGTVLLILFVISVATVRSIVVPIRQFMSTTERIAAGDDAARFARGGIKELDALAVSFNRMAKSLSDARSVTREYQELLELRVDERTRQLQHLAQHDPLTSLPNRRRLVAHLNAALDTAAREGHRVAVFFIDLDNFKNINDSMGHAFGDLVLQGVAQRLREAAEPAGFAARLGGDEFTVVYANVGGYDEVSEMGSALVNAFQRPLSIERRELVISISAGASICPDHERDCDALLRAADAALFLAKNSGRARVSLFSPELLQAAALKFSLEQGLRRALEHNELELWFQPEVSFATLETKLVEALLRWRLPDGAYLTPAHFLSIAEDSGLLTHINDWVLRTAIRHAAEWHHGAWPDARVAINVSARQLLDTSFVAGLCRLLEEYRLPPRCIEIELTETVLQTEAATVEVLRELRRLGVSVALDDFGTGYSSLASLEKLPLTRVKLDRSLIDTIDTSTRSLAIARAIVGLCTNLGLEVTAEGVERQEQLALLIGSAAMTVQGFLIARPIQAGGVPDALAALGPQLESLLVAGALGLPTQPAEACDTRAPIGAEEQVGS